MKLVIALMVCLCCEASFAWRIFFRGRARDNDFAAPDVSMTQLPEEQWFKQKLDHFDPTNLIEWDQRYFVNDSFFDSEKGPVFLMIGGEAEANPKWVVNGTWLRFAAKYKALCILLEHRYYGKSHPVSDLNVRNLLYLTSQQALGDIASFIVGYNNKLGSHRKWIVFGGSYPGSLAAWVRLKYPHLVTGAVSSSGPLVAVADFADYYRVVEESLSTYSPKCVESIEEGTKQFTILLQQKSGRRRLMKLFKLCGPVNLNNTNDLSNLYESLASNFAGIVQYNQDNRHTSDNADVTIDSACDIMMNKTIGQEVERLAKVNSLLLQNSNESCLDFDYKSMLKELRGTLWSDKGARGLRQWTYQTCTEFGFYQTSALNSTKLLFGSWFPVEFFEQQCREIYGEKFNHDLLAKGIRRTNTIYGGLDVRTDNVVFVHGSIDPWHALGITKTLREKTLAIFINGTAHCADMYPSSPKDLPDLENARNQTEYLIGTWLKAL